MDIQDIELEVRKAVALQINCRIDFQIEQPLVKLGADSLDAVELLLWAEDRFEINIPDELAETVETASQMVTIISQLVSDT